MSVLWARVFGLLLDPPRGGKTLLPDERIKAVMFTGSTATAKVIARELAKRQDAPVPLVAETGGQNCMVVDSTALLEQVVDDVIQSGFHSAGQRCSALRVLLLQEDIADKAIAMITGGMQELRLGCPEKISSDIGPVIDTKALQGLREHVNFLDQCGRAKALYTCDIPAGEQHYFFAPRF